MDWITIVSLLLFAGALYASAKLSEVLVRLLLSGRGRARRGSRPGSNRPSA